MTSEGSGERSPIVDFAAHLHPSSVDGSGIFAFIEAQVGVPVHEDPERFAELYERVGIDYAVLSQPNYMGHGDAPETRAANDELLSVLADYDQFFGLAALPVAAGGDEAAAEFERCLAEGYHGGALETRSGGIELTDRELEPVLEVADESGAPILVHPPIHDSLHPDVLDDTWQLNAIWGRETALCESLFKVIHEGVLDRYPDLHLVYHHCGGGIAGMMGRIQLYLEGDRFPEKERLLDYAEFKRRLEERIYVDLSGHFGRPGVYRRTLEEFPSTRILFGTDFPYETRQPAEFDKLVSSVRETATITGSDRILGGNALELLDG